MHEAARTLRRRKMFPFFTGFMLLYGRHSSVHWVGPWTCRIDAPRFAASIGTNTAGVRKALEWLRTHRYASELDWGQGWVLITLTPPIDRQHYLVEGAA